MWTSDGLIMLPECIQLKKALLAVFLRSMERSNWQFCTMQGLLICLNILGLLFEIRHAELQGGNAGFICAAAFVTTH